MLSIDTLKHEVGNHHLPRISLGVSMDSIQQEIFGRRNFLAISSITKLDEHFNQMLYNVQSSLT